MHAKPELSPTAAPVFLATSGMGGRGPETGTTIWHPDPSVRKEFLEGLCPILDNPQDSDLAQVLIGLTDPVYDNRDAAAKLLVRATYILLYGSGYTKEIRLGVMNRLYAWMAHPPVLCAAAEASPIEIDPRLKPGERFEPRRSLAHTRLMALRMIQHCAEESPRCLPIFQEYGAHLESSLGLLTRAAASRCARESVVGTPASRWRSELPVEITEAPPALQLWRMLQATRAYLTWHPQLVEQHAWARGIQQAWQASAQHLSVLQNAVL